jgi:predicted permease
MFGRKREAGDFSAEIEGHMQLESERLQELGLSEGEARAAARRAFGNVMQTEERFYESGRWLWWDHLLRDVRFGLRTLRKSPGFTAVAVLTLALGIGANAAMFSVIDGVLLKPLDYREPDRLISIHLRNMTQKNLGITPIAPYLYKLWHDHAATLENIAIVRTDSANLTGVGEPERVFGARVSWTLLPTLGVGPVLGRSFSASEDIHQGPRVVILSNGFWRRRFGADPGAIGREIQLDGASFSVIGVMAAGFELPIDLETERGTSHLDLLLPGAFGPDEMENHNCWGVARLKPGVTVEQTSADLDANLLSTKSTDVRHAVVARLQSNMTERVQSGLSLLMAAVGLVLLIACGNLANLQLSRTLTRKKEIAVRAALGAGRGQIIRQLLSESLVLSMLGGAAGVTCAGWILKGILTQIPEDLPHRAAISVDGRALVFCVVLTFLCALLFGALPAWRFSKVDPQEAFRQSQRGAADTRGSIALRQWLIVAQVALCTMLLIGSGLLIRSFAKILSIDRGFATENVLTADIPLDGERYDQPVRRNTTYHAIEERLAGIPGVSVAGTVSWLPLSGNEYRNAIFLPGTRFTPESGRDLPFAQIRFATPGYFRAAGVPLRSGRIFSEAGGDMWSAVVSDSAARLLWPERNPIGQEFSIDRDAHPRIWRVAGVVADVRQVDLQSPAPLMVYLPTAHNRGFDLSFVLRTTLPASSIAPSIREAVRQIDPDVAVTSIRAMSEIVARSTAQRRFQVLLLATFAAIAMLLAALGIYGTLSYSVNQRYREIGIRLALGANGRDVGTMVMRQALTPVVLGLAAGCGGAFLLMRTMAALLYGVGSGDAVTYSVSGTLILVVAVVSCWLPALRAMRLNPVETIRCE